MGSFVWKVLSGVVFVRSPFVRIHLLQQKVKHHFNFSKNLGRGISSASLLKDFPVFKSLSR